MAILNYTTSIKSEKTLMEIQQCLVKHGATKVVMDYNLEIPIALTFALQVNTGDGTRLLAFSLPARWQGVLRSMKNDRKVPQRLCTDEQAIRVCWRIIKVWVEAQMALVEAEISEVSEVFLPYAVTKDGNTLFQELRAGGMKQIQQSN